MVMVVLLLRKVFLKIIHLLIVVRERYAWLGVFLLVNGLKIVSTDQNRLVFVLGLHNTGRLNFENLQVGS